MLNYCKIYAAIYDELSEPMYIYFEWNQSTDICFSRFDCRLLTSFYGFFTFKLHWLHLLYCKGRTLCNILFTINKFWNSYRTAWSQTIIFVSVSTNKKKWNKNNDGMNVHSYAVCTEIGSLCNHTILQIYLYFFVYFIVASSVIKVRVY